MMVIYAFESQRYPLRIQTAVFIRSEGAPMDDAEAEYLVDADEHVDYI